MSNFMAELYDRVGGTVPPTNVRFFHPNEEFWKMMDAYKHMGIIDVGCGKGDLVNDLRERGFKASGVDHNASAEQRIMQGIHGVNALRLPIADTFCYLICRPDHSGWCEPFIRRVLEGGGVAIYISKPTNIDRDVGDVIEDFEHVTWPGTVGEEGEHAIKFMEFD